MVHVCDCKACPLIGAPWPGIPAAKLLLGIWDRRETDGKADLRLRFTDLQLVLEGKLPRAGSSVKPVKATGIRIAQVRTQTPILCGSWKAYDFESSLLSGPTASLPESD